MNFFLLISFIIICLLIVALERKCYVPFIKWIFIIPFVWIVSIRSMKVPDTEMYLEYFDLDHSDFFNFSLSTFEVGFQFFTKITKFFISDRFTFFLGLIAFINLIIIWFSTNRISKLYQKEQFNSDSISVFEGENRFFSNCSFSILPLTLYVCFFGLYFNTIVLRVGMTLSLVVLASSIAVKNKKNVLDYALIISILVLGYFFHSTAVFGFLIILILLSDFKFSKKNYLWIWFVIGIIYFTNFSTWLANSVFSFMLTLNEVTVLATKLSSYEGNVTQEIEGVSMKFMFFWIMSFFLIFYSINSKIYFKYLNVYLIGLLIFGLFRSILLIERVTDYFLLFSFVCFYLFLIMQKPLKFWLYFIPIVSVQLVFVLRITN